MSHWKTSVWSYFLSYFLSSAYNFLVYLHWQANNHVFRSFFANILYENKYMQIKLDWSVIFNLHLIQDLGIKRKFYYTEISWSFCILGLTENVSFYTDLLVHWFQDRWDSTDGVFFLFIPRKPSLGFKNKICWKSLIASLLAAKLAMRLTLDLMVWFS